MNAHPTAVEITEAVEAERARLLSSWSRSSADWVEMYREATDVSDTAMRWVRIHKYLGYPIVFTIGAAIGHFV